MNRPAAADGGVLRRVHSTTRRDGISSAKCSLRTTPRFRPESDSSSVTPATPRPMRASEMSRLWLASSISGLQAQASLQEAVL